MSKLVINDPTGEHTHLIDGPVTIGRHPRSIICLHDPLISKHHAVIHANSDGYVFEDIGSSNGSFLDGVRVYKHKFSDEDIVTMGKVSITFYAESADEHLARLVNITNISESSQIHDRIELSSVEHFMPEREVIDLGMLRVDYEKLRLGHELMQHIGLDRDLNAVLEKVANELLRMFVADRCVIMLARPGSDELIPKVVHTLNGVDDQVVVSQSILNEVKESRSAVLLSDTSQDDKFSHASSIVMQGIRSVMCAPIMHDGEFYGVVHFDSQRGHSSFTRKDLQLLTGIVHYVALAVANSKLLKKIESEARTKAQFERLLSPSVVDMVMSGKVKLEKGGELRDLTILFADIRGFTRMANRSSATAIVAMLNRYFEMIVDVVFKYGGTVDKYIGDEIMVLFGAPIDLEDAADRAVLCALEMQAVLKQFNKDRREGDDLVEIGVGINSGEVVVGSIGSSQTMQYTCIGNAVNVASRLTGMAKAGEVIISKNTLDQVQGDMEYDELPPVAIKGIDGELSTYKVKDLLPNTED
ncbi:MAG: adenylate/guanylate cyclase domain-containing protein [Mariprofundaceae bacterium]